MKKWVEKTLTKEVKTHHTEVEKNPHREVEKRHMEVEITHTGRWRRPHGGGGQTHTEVGDSLQ